MKKILNLMIAFCCVLSCAVVFAGCNITKCTHTASEDWEMNNTHHWHKCTDCGEKLDKAEHDWQETVLIEAGQGEDGVLRYTCHVCGMQKTEEYFTTTVTQAEWNTALALSNFDKVEINCAGEYENGDIQSSITRIKDGDIMLVTIVEEDVETNEYYSKESGRYYLYSKDGADWIKEEISQSDYEDELGLLDAEFTYSDFVYNEELAAYECDLGVTSSQAYFKNDRLVKMAASFDDGDEEVYTIEYDNIELELPEATLVTVTAAEWNNALDLSNFSNYKMTVDSMDMVFGEISADGDIIYASYLGENEYYTIEGGKYYIYTQDTDVWSKAEIDEHAYNVVTSFKGFAQELASQEIYFSDFTYNAELHAYQFECEREWSEGAIYSKTFILYFNNGRCIKIKTENYEPELDVTYTFEYDTIQLELPAAILVTVTESEWNSAMNLLCVDNYKVYATGELPDGTIVVDGTITKYGDIVYHDSMPDDNGYYSKEGNNYYYYQEAFETWAKFEITQDEYESYAGKNIGEYVYSAFVYNYETKAYEANVEGVFFQVYFANGRLVKMVGSQEDYAQIMLIEYDNIELELPEEYSTTMINSDIYDNAMALYNYNKVKVSLGEDSTIVKDGYKMHYDIDVDLWGYYDYDEQTGKYYRYRTINETEVWGKTEITSGEYYDAYYGFDLSTGTIGLSSMGVVYEALDYNSELSAYECIIDGEANKVIMYFDCGKLVRFDLIMGQESAVCTIEYDNIELELPIVG